MAERIEKTTAAIRNEQHKNRHSHKTNLKT
jgi:hypothetical protein